MIADALEPAEYHALIRTVLGAQAALLSVLTAVYIFTYPLYWAAIDRLFLSFPLAFQGKEAKAIYLSQMKEILKSRLKSLLDLLIVWPLVLPVECVIYTHRCLSDQWLLTMVNCISAAFALHLYLVLRQVVRFRRQIELYMGMAEQWAQADEQRDR